VTIAGKRVLVTGADGFIGSHVVEACVAAGADVRAFCIYNSNGSHGWLDGVARDVRDAVEFRLGDIRDAEFVSDTVVGCDIVLHLAALISIPYSYTAPRSFVETNVIGTLNILEAARRHGTARVVNTSTSEVYGTPEVTPITELHPLRAQSPYSATKIGADKLCEAWARSYELPVVTLRPFNTFGPRQSARAVIPTILSQILAGAAVIRLGSRSTRRDFTFVSDTVRGFLLAAIAALEPGEVVHLGTGETWSIGQVVEEAQLLLGTEIPVVADEDRLRPEASEVQVLLSDPSYAKERLGWAPLTAFRDGLSATAQWLEGRVDPATAAVFHT
jgi:UDP-glucose 4-epimerase